MAKHPAAFINAIAEGRNFDEAIKYLQETWDELQDLKGARREGVFVIVFFKDDLWWFQDQGHSSRETDGGFASKQAAIKSAAEKYGENVRIEVR